jgi:AcrR family transcriptional regulator
VTGTDGRSEQRRLLEDAATQLFAELGYSSTTVDAIVDQAGLAKPALYRHFPSKKELFLALIASHGDALAAAALDQIDETRLLSNQLEAMVDAWFGYVERHPYACQLLFRNVTGDGDIEAAYARLRQRQVDNDVLLLRQLSPHIPSEQIDPLAEIIRSSLAGLALWWLEHPNVPRRVLVTSMLRVLHGMVCAPSPAASATPPQP